MDRPREFVIHSLGDARRFLAWMADLVRHGVNAPLHVEVALWSAKRTVEQNARWWWLMRQIAEQAVVNGRKFPAEAWHVQMKGHFMGWLDLPNGKLYASSSTKYSRRELAGLMDEVEAYATTELGVRFPVNPNERR